MDGWYPHIHVIQPLWIRLMVGRQRCLRMVFNRISVRFLMALVQWCSGYVSFLKTPVPYFKITGVALISGGWKPIL